ncbi:MAG: hypothetical protein R3E04_01875 [Sphingobium sp.]
MDRFGSKTTLLGLLTALSVICVPMPASAYIGPGLGAGAIGAVLGVLGSIFLGLFAIIYYPFKRMMKKRKKSQQNSDLE